MLALMGGTEAGRVEIAALADRRVNALLALADTDRDAAISRGRSRPHADRLATAIAARGHAAPAAAATARTRHGPRG